MPIPGWFIDDIVITNCSVLLQPIVGLANGTTFLFQPNVATNYFLEARGLMFDTFGLSWGPSITLNPAVPPEMLTPSRNGSQLQMEFLPGTTPVTTLQLYKSGIVTGPWSLDGAASRDTNLISGHPRFTTTVDATGPSYFRIGAP